MATNDTPPHTELSSASLVPQTPVKPRQAPHKVPHAYPTPQSAKKQPAWTSSDLDTPRPGGTQAEELRSKKRARDAEVVYVDSGSDSEDVVQTPIKKKARKTGTGGGKSKTKRGDSVNGRKVGSWTKEEIRALWDAIFVPPVSSPISMSTPIHLGSSLGPASVSARLNRSDSDRLGRSICAGATAGQAGRSAILSVRQC